MHLEVVMNNTGYALFFKSCMVGFEIQPSFYQSWMIGFGIQLILFQSRVNGLEG